MRRTVFQIGLTIAGVLFLLDWMLRALPASPATGFDVTVYILVSMVVFLDLIDMALRLYVERRQWGSIPTSVPIRVGTFNPYQMKTHLRPYALIVSVHNAEDELDTFLEAMAPYRKHLWVIDDASTDRTFLRLRQAGIQCIRGETNRKKPGALKELLEQLPPEIRTVGIFDPDISIQNHSSTDLPDLERSLFIFQRSGFAAVCPRIEVRQDGWLARLQGLEYAITFAIGRKSLADGNITSGVSFYRRDALEHIFRHHNLSVYAEDLRNALVLLGHGEQIYYDERLVMDTDGKRTLAGWFSQRVGWYFGLIKVYHDSFEDVKRVAGRRAFFVYHYIFYMGIWAILLHPLKIIAVALSLAGVVNAFDDLLGLSLIPNTRWSDPLYFLLAYAKYTILAGFMLLISPKGERRRLLPAVPIFYLYQLLHLIPITVGFLNWFTLRYLGRRVYRDHFQDEESLVREFRLQFGGGPA